VIGGLAIGAAGGLVLSLARRRGWLPSPSAKDVKLTVLLSVGAAVAMGQALESDWTYSTRLGPVGAAAAAVGLAGGGILLFAIACPRVVRASRSGILFVVGLPLAGLLGELLPGLAQPDGGPTARPPATSC